MSFSNLGNDYALVGSRPQIPPTEEEDEYRERIFFSFVSKFMSRPNSLDSHASDLNYSDDVELVQSQDLDFIPEKELDEGKAHIVWVDLLGDLDGARTLLAGLKSKPFGWCQLVDMATNKPADKERARHEKQGYVQLTAHEVNKAGLINFKLASHTLKSIF